MILCPVLDSNMIGIKNSIKNQKRHDQEEAQIDLSENSESEEAYGESAKKKDRFDETERNRVPDSNMIRFLRKLNQEPEENRTDLRIRKSQWQRCQKAESLVISMILCPVLDSDMIGIQKFNQEPEEAQIDLSGNLESEEAHGEDAKKKNR
ncbi:hypothetical protein JCGZ_13123 [Jatropha curcas]|uniref:Uncharacterized protein n=1 Tax=Jatropha curcas TaxID=180498 RepID=A0A067KC26_JATCU|nr:hypothetical protein JCGZ_13123 [Jatropha curcas]